MKHKQVLAWLSQKKQIASQWIKTHKKISIAVGVILVLLVGGAVSFLLVRDDQKVNRTTPQSEIKEVEKPVIVYSPLSGEQVSPEAAQRPVTAIMIENSPEARPQSALDKAGVIFEAIAEGGITRFIALYQENRPNPIGPVRSLRPYFIDWVLAYDASAAHVGGSAQALDEVRDLNIKDLDQFFNGDSYYRTSDRYAPHNVYTDFDLLDSLNQAKGYTSSSFTPVKRTAKETPVDVATANHITINPSSYLYQADYDYQKGCNCYRRFQAGEPHIDRESGQQLSPKNVVVLNVENYGIEYGRWAYDLVGSGKATIFRDGTVIEGVWKKTARDGMLRLYNAEDKEIGLNPGQTWYSTLDSDQAVGYSQ